MVSVTGQQNLLVFRFVLVLVLVPGIVVTVRVHEPPLEWRYAGYECCRDVLPLRACRKHLRHVATGLM